MHVRIEASSLSYHVMHVRMEASSLSYHVGHIRKTKLIGKTRRTYNTSLPLTLLWPLLCGAIL